MALPNLLMQVFCSWKKRKKCMLSARGQESAPFELLIAIIVMTFVIIIGFNALNALNTQTCRGNLEQNLEQIKAGIEQVVKDKSKANVSFELPGCFSEEQSRLKIIERDELDFCSHYCGGSLSQCTVLQFSSPEFTSTKCLRISSATVFPNADSCPIEVLEGGSERYTVSEWKSTKSGIEPGQYTLVRQFNLFSNAPVICAYKRKV